MLPARAMLKTLSRCVHVRHEVARTTPRPGAGRRSPGAPEEEISMMVLEIDSHEVTCSAVPMHGGHDLVCQLRRTWKVRWKGKEPVRWSSHAGSALASVDDCGSGT